jgi:hypothetical protein
MAKINLAAEKRLKNEEYAKKYEKKEEQPRGKKKEKPKPKYANWCRAKGHPASCTVQTCPSP